jgi:hypothetical protein
MPVGVPAQGLPQDSLQPVKVHFLYGSKPRNEYKFLEKKYFGGLHGGHVSIEVGNEVIGFEPCGKFHVFGRRRQLHSQFRSKPILQWMDDSSGMQYTSVTVRLTPAQYHTLEAIHADYLSQSPYDYAFFGMRCAAATYDILSRIAVVPRHNRHWIAARYFYPKLLRKRLLKLARERNYPVARRAGRGSRKWEKD